MGKPISSYWNTQGATQTLGRITDYEGQKSYRPTVVVPIVDYAGRPLLVRHNTKEQNWGLVQGHIEDSDPDPVAACRREAFEEALVTDEKIDRIYPFLWEESVDIGPRDFQTGYTKGGYYVCVGIKLRPGADVVVNSKENTPALVERCWCSSLDLAIHMLRTQPEVPTISATWREKVERVLIPALESMYQPYVEERAEVLNYDYLW